MVAWCRGLGFGVIVGGRSFGVDARDLVLLAGQGECMSVVHISGAGLAVFGDAF
jgi:hypothetical protein